MARGVYALATRQELPHVRVSNAIRFQPEDLQSFLGQQSIDGRLSVTDSVS